MGLLLLLVPADEGDQTAEVAGTFLLLRLSAAAEPDAQHVGSLLLPAQLEDLSEVDVIPKTAQAIWRRR